MLKPFSIFAATIFAVAANTAMAKEIEVGPQGLPQHYSDGTLLGPFLAQGGENVHLVDKAGMRLTRDRARCYLVFVDDRGSREERTPWFNVWTDEEGEWRLHARGDGGNRAHANCFLPNPEIARHSDSGITDAGLVTVPLGTDHAMVSGWIGLDPSLDFRVDRGEREFDVTLDAPGIGKLVAKTVRAGCDSTIRRSEWGGPGEHWHGELETPELRMRILSGRAVNDNRAVMRVRASAYVRHHEEGRDRIVREINLTCTLTAAPPPS